MAREDRAQNLPLSSGSRIVIAEAFVEPQLIDQSTKLQRLQMKRLESNSAAVSMRPPRFARHGSQITSSTLSLPPWSRPFHSMADAVRDKQAEILPSSSSNPEDVEGMQFAGVRGQWLARGAIAGFSPRTQGFSHITRSRLCRLEAADRQLALGGVPLYLRKAEALAASQPRKNRHSVSAPHRLCFGQTKIADLQTMSRYP